MFLFEFERKDSVLPVCHSDDEDVVELVHAVDLAEQLVHHRVVHTGVAGLRPASLKIITLLTDWRPHTLQMASISSKMMMWRPEFGPSRFSSSSASSNRRRIFASLSPTYLSRIYEIGLSVRFGIILLTIGSMPANERKRLTFLASRK